MAISVSGHKRTAGLGSLKAAARDAAEQLDFDEVEALLSRVDEVETETAESKVLRAETALLRGRAGDAFRMLSAVGNAFGSDGPLEPTRRRLMYGDRLYSHELRHEGAGLAMAERMMHDALENFCEQASPELWADLKNCFGIGWQAQVERLGGEAGAALLGEAVDAYQAAQRVRTEAAHPVDWAMTMENVGLAHELLAENAACDDPRAALSKAAECFEIALRAFDLEHMPHNPSKASIALARARVQLAR